MISKHQVNSTVGMQIMQNLNIIDLPKEGFLAGMLCWVVCHIYCRSINQAVAIPHVNVFSREMSSAISTSCFVLSWVSCSLTKQKMAGHMCITPTVKDEARFEGFKTSQSNESLPPHSDCSSYCNNFELSLF